MALRRIITENDEALRKKSREVTAFDGRLHQLLDDMAETMDDINGVGLAAVQVGILRRVAVVDIGEGRIELINPVITENSEETVTSFEGCLSYPNKRGLVERPKKVTVKACDRHGKEFSVTGEDLLARALCHELGHMDGVILKDVAIRMIREDELPDDFDDFVQDK